MSQITFAPIPNEILRRTDLSPGAKLCCARLIQYAGKDGQAFPKLVTTQQRGRGQSNIYHVDKSILIHNPKLTTTDLSTLNRTDSSTLDTTDSSTPYKGRKENFKKEIEKITAGVVHNMRMPR